MDVPHFGASQVVLMVKNLPANAGDVRDEGLIPGARRSPGGGHGNPFQYSFLESPLDRGAWQATVHSAAESWTRISDLTIYTHTHIYIHTNISHLPYPFICQWTLR